MIDVSSIKELRRRWYPRTYYGQPAKGLAHRALADIKESIRELDYYRNTVFVPGPGPDVDSRQGDRRRDLRRAPDRLNRAATGEDAVRIATPCRPARTAPAPQPPRRIEAVLGYHGRARRSVRSRLRVSTVRHCCDGGCSSAGRAPGCGPGGRGFKSRQPPVEFEAQAHERLRFVMSSNGRSSVLTASSRCQDDQRANDEHGRS